MRAPSDAREHVVDHSGEAEAPAVFRRVDLGDPVGLELGDFAGEMVPPPPTTTRMCCGAELAQHVDHVAEVFVVSALVAADGDGVGIFGDGGTHDVGDAAVVAQMHHLGAARLQQAADHVDGGVVAVEQRRGADESQRPAGLWWLHVTGW